MAAVMTISSTRHRTGPTTRAMPRETRTVYVRRRVTAVLLGVALVVAMAQAGAALGGSTLAAPERRPTVLAHTVVLPGDSLWSVAQRLAPGEDPRPVVDALAHVRHGAVLVAGERIEWGG